MEKEKTFIVGKIPPFEYTIHYQTASEKRKFDEFMKKYEIIIHADLALDLDNVRHGNREIHWSSDVLTSRQVLVGKAYRSHPSVGFHSFRFTSNDKPLPKEEKKA